MEYINKSILCLSYDDFISVGVPEGTYKTLKNRDKITVHGRGGNGNTVLIEFESLPHQYKAMVVAKYGDPYQYMARQPIRDLIKPDYKAIEFFQKYVTPKGGTLSEKHLVEYPNDAAILNALDYLLQDKQALKRILNVSIGKFWDAATDLVKDLKNEYRYKNTLPTSSRHLKPLFASYKAEGYEALISKAYGNSNTKKHDEQFENLVLSLYSRKGAKQNASDILDDYKLFMAGKIEVVDMETGETFDRERFTKDGQPLSCSQTQMWSIINRVKNRPVVDSLRNGRLYNDNRHNPIAFRKAPQYAFSKCTMDDIQLPFKLTDGEDALAYQAMDVCSTAIVATAFAKSAGKESGKDRGLFMACIKDLFATIVNNGWGVPAEMEVEQHISSTFKDDILRDGFLFQHIRWCQGSRPREKRAEGFIKAKKYGYQAKIEGFGGRFYARNETFLPNKDEKRRLYTFDQVIANERAAIEAYNHDLHPDQKKFPGKTRWQVLSEMQNPNLPMPHMPMIAKHVGETTRDAVQIYNNQWFHAGNAKWIIPNDQRSRLTSRYIRPYWITNPANEDGMPDQVYIYQDNSFIATCNRVERFNEAWVERTEEDEAIMERQFKYLSEYKSQVKEGKAKVKNVAVVTAFEDPKHTVEIIPEPQENEAEAIVYDADFWTRKALQDF